jgi:aryl-alcohol dehydrogenase-like predicted oxidoreductase
MTSPGVGGGATGTVWHDQTREEGRPASSYCARTLGAPAAPRVWALKSLRVHRGLIHHDQDLADPLGHQSGDVALAWLPTQPAVTAPIIGARTQEQLDAALRAPDVELAEPTRIRLHEFFPGCRTSCEDYTW